jgi:signal transduction histidine kinase
MCHRPASSTRLDSWLLVLLLAFGSVPFSADAVILWNNPGAVLVHQTGAGNDLLHGALKRDDSASDTLYFKCHVVPLSDTNAEEYFAAIELFDGDTERLGVGNSLKAWAYSAFFQAEAKGIPASDNPSGYFDLRTANPEISAGGITGTYQYPRKEIGATIIFKIQFIPGEDDLVTVWLNPDLGPGANEILQPEALTTRFNANASFDEIRLRHGGGGDGWWFSDIAVATSFGDFVDGSSERPGVNTSGDSGVTGAFDFQSWQKEQGLPVESVSALAQTADGYLWLAGENRLTRFDGLRFRPFPKPADLDCTSISTMLGDSRGTLWIGCSSNGLFRLQDNAITKLDELPTKTVNALAEDNDGRIWIGTAAGLVIYQNGHFTTLNGVEALANRAVTSLFKDKQGTMWIAATGAGVFKFANNTLIPAKGESVDESLKSPHCVLVDQAGRLWVAASEDLILCQDGGRWTRHRLPHNQAKSFISTLAEEADGTIWAGSVGGGLLQFKDGAFAPVPANCGLTGHSIKSLFADHEGRLWVATDAGLCRLRRTIFTSLGQTEGLGLGAVFGLAEAVPGVVWAGKAGGGLYRWNGKSFSRLSAAGLAHDSQISAMLTARDGGCWVATTNSLLFYKDPVAAADEVTPIPEVPPGIISLAEDHGGALLAGTADGKLWRLWASQWQPLANFPPTNAVTAIEAAPDNSVWIGTGGDGLWQLVGNSLRHMGKTSGNIHTLHLDAQGTLWIGTSEQGLCRWRDGQLSCFSTNEGLPDNSITQILEDHAGRLWLGSRHGIVCLNTNSLNELARGGTTNIAPMVFGRKEGMLSDECTGGVFPSGLKTRSSLLWFPTQQGVVIVNARYQLDTAQSPNTLLEEVLVDGHSDDSFLNQPTGPFRISPGKHQVEFRFTGLKSGTPEAIRFRYQLEGLDAGWVEAGTRRVALYNYLPPGHFRFRVAACNWDGVWSPQETGVELVVQRFFWQTWWFVLLAGSGLLLATVTAVRVIEKQKAQRRLKQMEQAHALERERTRIAQDLHDEMGAKLCRISFLSEHVRRGNSLPEELHEQIATISDASREVLHSLDEIVWAVNPQNDTLEHMASYLGQYAEDYFQMTGIQCELDIPTQLPALPLSSHTRHHLFLAVHEALTNILKHSRATHASLSVSLQDGLLKIIIADNGRGFTISKKSGDGLINLEKRLADIGGQCFIESAPGQGTTIRFVLPLHAKITTTKNSEP